MELEKFIDNFETEINNIFKTSKSLSFSFIWKKNGKKGQFEELSDEFNSETTRRILSLISKRFLNIIKRNDDSEWIIYLILHGYYGDFEVIIKIINIKKGEINIIETSDSSKKG